MSTADDYNCLGTYYTGIARSSTKLLCAEWSRSRNIEVLSEVYNQLKRNHEGTARETHSQMRQIDATRNNSGGTGQIFAIIVALAHCQRRGWVDVLPVFNAMVAIAQGHWDDCWDAEKREYQLLSILRGKKKADPSMV